MKSVSIKRFQFAVRILVVISALLALGLQVFQAGQREDIDSADLSGTSATPRIAREDFIAEPESQFSLSSLQSIISTTMHEPCNVKAVLFLDERQRYLTRMGRYSSTLEFDGVKPFDISMLPLAIPLINYKDSRLDAATRHMSRMLRINHSLMPLTIYTYIDSTLTPVKESSRPATPADVPGATTTSESPANP